MAVKKTIKEKLLADNQIHNEGGEPQLQHAEEKGILSGFTPYLSPEARANLPLYKYRASDNGIVYQNFFNPFGNWFVEQLPDWLAPNTITFVGFIFSFTPYVALIWLYSSHYYNPKGMKDIPAWILYL